MAKSISAYKFVTVEDPAALRVDVLRASITRDLKGWVLLSHEGINVFVCGTGENIDSFVVWLRGLAGLHDLDVKASHSDDVPFALMLVKVKKSIIAFRTCAAGPNVAVDPIHDPAPKISPRELKKWLDDGRSVVLLDTRNDYEMRMGSFINARHLNIRRFTDFGTAALTLDPALKDQEVVTFCTGGIRCEKAAPYLSSLGFRNVHQLDGGILRYFEECGGAHYRGECFVFDKRVGVDAQLRETATVMCFRCRMPLSLLDQTSADYVFGTSCPYCV